MSLKDGEIYISELIIFAIYRRRRSIWKSLKVEEVGRYTRFQSKNSDLIIEEYVFKYNTPDARGRGLGKSERPEIACESKRCDYKSLKGRKSQ
uniref:Integrase catalytic domain-containing protein n=1 Tax=Caenorhabditis tropicalis TaxID=1561998 RepID=A0A1I7T420_9PELO